MYSHLFTTGNGELVRQDLSPLHLLLLRASVSVTAYIVTASICICYRSSAEGDQCRESSHHNTHG